MVGAASERQRVVVIGGGVIGCAILFELARRGVAGLLIEAAPDLCEGTSKANSAILHTGFDSKPGTIESTMLRRAAAMWPERLEELSVPSLRVGALMIARTKDEATRLASTVEPGARALGVTTDLLDRVAVRHLAPYLADDVVAALAIPGESIVDPFWLTRAFAEAAIAGGAEVRLGNTVTRLEVVRGAVLVGLSDGNSIRTDQVIDAAGVHADDIATLAGDRSFGLTPRKGEFLISEETFGVDRIVLPIPGPMGKGMLITPIVFGGLLLGPTAVDVEHKDDRSTSVDERARILQACRAMVPAVADMVPIRQFAGIRHVSSTGDFILRPSTAGDRIYLAAGIRSTGISTSPAVAEAVVEDVVRRRGWKAPSGRRLEAPRIDLPEEPGEVVCICRSISRAEVLAACRHPLAPTTLDAVKRRGGATFGDCQGNLCGLQIASMIAEEQGVPLARIEKHLPGSWLWKARATPRGRRTSRQARSVPVRHARANVGGPFDVVVIGGGRSGRAAAEAASHRGSRVAVVERRPNRAGPFDRAVLQLVLEATAVALQPKQSGWWVLAQDGSGAVELETSAVIVATGAYVEPREHRPIGGARPAGVMTADLAESILDAGLRPGHRALVVGRGSRTDRLVSALLEAGTEVIRGEAPDELAGERRLEAVRHGTDWLAADTLILADRLLAQTFLLRGLGLVDGRPGINAPVDEAGRLALPGLWAVGCCVRPSTEHGACGDAGRRIGERVSRSLVASGGAAGGRTQVLPDRARGRRP